jgi:hypothetical protein
MSRICQKLKPKFEQGMVVYTLPPAPKAPPSLAVPASQVARDSVSGNSLPQNPNLWQNFGLRDPHPAHTTCLHVPGFDRQDQPSR